jgi:hypothetical protein
VITFPGNARDPWIPDAVAMAGAKHGPAFVRDLIGRRVPNDSLAVAGMRRAVHKLGRIHAAQKDLAVVTALISSVPSATSALAVAMLNGIAEGWPLDTAAAPPNFTAEQKAALVAAATGASPELAEAFAKIAARWNTPNAFKPE